jgi:hypothetical protein
VALVPAAEKAGAEVLVDRIIQHKMSWDSPAHMWEGMTRAGPWHVQRLQRGDEFVDSLREEWSSAFESDQPLVHTPNARMLVLRRKSEVEAANP